MSKFISGLALAVGLVAGASSANAQKAEMPTPDSFKPGDK